MRRSGIDTIKYLAHDTNGKVTNSQLDTTNESQEGSPLPAGDHKAHINSRAQRHSKQKTEKTQNIHKRSTTLERSVNILPEVINQFHGANLALNSDVGQKTFGKVTKHNKHGSQEVSLFPAGDHKTTMNRHDSTTHANMKHY